MDAIINFHDFWQLVPLVRESLVAAAILAVVSGILSPLVQLRDAAFAVHGTSELSFAGASVALFLGASVTGGAIAGSIVAALLMSATYTRRWGTNALIGVLLPFGLGIGVLFLALYKGRSANKFGLLTGQIVSVDENQLTVFAVVGILVLVTIACFGRRLYYAAVDPVVALSKGVSPRVMNLCFMLILGLVVALAVQMVGALLVLSLLITPGAAAARISANPLRQHAWSVLFALIAAEGGILLSLGPGLPISPYITTISFLIFLICWAVGTLRNQTTWSRRKQGLSS
ncbi:metal ABC transporter permease [Mobiluncus curtisii]|uniref:ABC 3 transport family protein n=2 Tax=Mobiluncus curtisii TaxID=2051 RepID=D6ZGW2_MOBCV|nr:metal ABC transporter permease [Mobiluncus curtisii]ADI67870.1 ABC 3 transport family protein [Mobiluncus curtisii ATCC 43063]EFL94403.1 ABC 3 transport family protein [Mobiluncus curtisii subsp. curtisii ATCC 35241]MCV0000375.1 metal ABC transporter permease [Mobiluncus curtisii]MCV0020678.1 metal ABC transporter permease [Mobiluncus curtisii]NMW43027.1 metal ABC transporter permease [Mobiluncus curtisii]